MSLWRAGIFLIEGLSNFTLAAYLKQEAKFSKHALDVDLTNKAYVVTGANSGIGKETARALLARGGTVHMVCRNKQRGEEAQRELTQENPKGAAILHILDMSSIRAVKAFARSFVQRDYPLHGLVNNAGCMVADRQDTKEGLDVNTATNVIGTMVLTEELMPVLKKSAPARVVTVASGGMYSVSLDTEDPQCRNMKKYDGTTVYAQNKHAQVALGEKWTQLYKDTGVTFQTMHPGWADTPAVRESMPDFHAKLKDKFRTAAQGADTAVWLMIAQEALQYPGGSFFLDRAVQKKSLTMTFTGHTPEDADKLYANLKALAAPLEPSPDDIRAVMDAMPAPQAALR